MKQRLSALGYMLMAGGLTLAILGWAERSLAAGLIAFGLGYSITLDVRVTGLEDVIYEDEED